MLNAKDYQKKLADLEDATEKLKMEIFGVRYAIAGIVFEAKSNFKMRYDRIRDLEELEALLKHVVINVDDTEVHLELPKDLTIARKEKIVVSSWDKSAVRSLAKNFRVSLLEREGLFNIPEKKFVQKLVSVITDFEDAFFNYMQ